MPHPLHLLYSIMLILPLFCSFFSPLLALYSVLDAIYSHCPLREQLTWSKPCAEIKQIAAGESDKRITEKRDTGKSEEWQKREFRSEREEKLDSTIWWDLQVALGVKMFVKQFLNSWVTHFSSPARTSAPPLIRLQLASCCDLISAPLACEGLNS